MNLQNYHRLVAEHLEIERLLSHTPSENVIDRMSLEAREKKLGELIVSEKSSGLEASHARLTFSGKPVIGNHGIFAEFGTTAVNKFTAAIMSLAASLKGPLGARGNLPNREQYQLLITGTALGSFGFELEELLRDGELPFVDPTPVHLAIEKAKALMQATRGSDDDLADAASEIDQRALAALRDFVKTMADQEAVCALDFGGSVFRFKDVGEVRQSVDRLSQDNIREEEEEIEGAFQGVLPKRRSFEFKVASSQEIISGKVGSEIPDPSRINHILEKSVKISLLATRVGNGRPRYVLLSFEDAERE